MNAHCYQEPGLSFTPCYHLLTSRRNIPPFDLLQPADYIVAGDGILMRVPYMGMLMDFPVVRCVIRGLAPWATYCEGTREAGLAAEEDDDSGMLQPFAPRYHIARPRCPLPPPDPGRLYEYLVAGNGVFLRAERYGIEVLMPISPPCQLVGLATLEPTIRLPFPRVGREQVDFMLERARAQTRDGIHFDERLFYMLLRDRRWEIIEPEQEQRAERVEPVDKMLAARLGVFAEAHSHGRAAAFFSRTDDADEQWSGLYAVFGHIATEPEVCLRMVVDGYRWDCPAELLFELPPGVRDILRKRMPGRKNEQW